MSVFELWLPILLAGLATHILSTLFWTVSPHHKPDWNRLPIEDEFLELVSSRQVPANQYVFPYCGSGAEMQSEAFKAKQAKCTGMLVLWGAPVHMGAAIVKTLAFFLLAAFSVAYVASLALQKGAGFAEVFRFVTTVAILTHVYAKFPHSFWFKSREFLNVLDGLAYAVATGLIFAAMWPTA